MRASEGSGEQALGTGGIEQMVKNYRTLSVEQQQAVSVFMAAAKEPA
jgi:hypothetical protein